MNEKQDSNLSMKDEFDILMPAFNAALTIAQSIRSVQNQTCPHWKLWIIDDGSTDDTAAVVQKFLSDTRVHLLRQANRKQGAARNFGLKQGNGKWICFLDADDLWNSDKLEKQYQAQIESGATVTFSDGDIFWDDDDSQHRAFQTPRGYFAGPEMLQKLLKGNPVPILSACVRREALEFVNGFEESEIFHGVEDYDLWIRLAQAGVSFFGINGHLVRYRRHANAMTLDVATRLMPRELAVWERHFDSAQSLGMGAQVAAKIHLHYHVAALKMVEMGEIRSARQLIGSARVRRWESRSLVLKRAGLRLAPRVYMLIYNGLARIKQQLK